jgi:glycosyltransferase involved in cell wall biosynthesis
MSVSHGGGKAAPWQNQGPSDENQHGLRVVAPSLGIALVGTYPPRRCGIATFTRDLAEALTSAGERVSPVALALTDPGAQYDYGDEVKYEIRQGVKTDYARAAEFVNYSDVRLVLIQHEYGIFGGEDGAYVLDFMAALQVPAIVTLHTVLKHPSDSQRTTIQRMAKRCARMVVMSQVAADLLGSSHGIAPDRIQIIPHGIPEMKPRDQEALKAKFGVAGQPMLLTFGLLSPNKGIDTVIRALPAVTEAFPGLTYFVVGATHPVVARRHGQAYRTTLEREAEKLGVREHVVFRDQFVTTAELCSYLQATDIFISPYQNEAQVTSGALSYAMGAGAAAVSTPYWHAQELLGDGRGRLFPFGDSEALAATLRALLENPDELELVRTAAYRHTRSMVWPRVGKTYLELIQVVMDETPRRAPATTPLPASGLPELRLDHLVRMTDDTGIIQHATYSVPARSTGYCVDDNARALIVALEADRLSGSTETKKLVTTYLSYLHCAQTADGQFQNLMSYSRVFAGDRSEDCLGRAVWGLGTAVLLATDDGCRLLAREMFDRALPRLAGLGPRGGALAILGLANVLATKRDAAGPQAVLTDLSENLVRRYHAEASSDWRWFEPTLTYDNALLPLALFKSYRLTGERSSLRVARESLEFLEETCFHDGQLVLVGNAGWHSRGSVKAPADEQAIDAAAFVLAFHGAHLATGDRHYLRRMQESFAWFMGANRLGVPLYDFATAGCRDGLGVTQANQNEGAESTISFLLALLEMQGLAGDSPASDGPDSGPVRS